MRAVKTHDASVLVVGPRPDYDCLREALQSVAGVAWAETSRDAFDHLARSPVDVVIASHDLFDSSTGQFLDQLRREQPGSDFVAVCDPPSPDLSAGREQGVRAVDVVVRPLVPWSVRRLVETILLRRQLLEDNRRLVDRLHTADACRQLAPCLEAGSVYPVALDLLLSRLSRGRGFAVFRRGSVPLGTTAAFRGFSDDQAGRLRKALVEDKPIDLQAATAVGILSQGPVFDALRGLDMQIGSLLCIPIEGELEHGGVVWICDDGRLFDDDEVERSRLIASYAKAALENAERYQLAKERAFVDDVTEVYNARYLLSATDNELRRADRYETPLSVLFLDLDRFKLVNDRFGHLVGSQTLRSLSQVLLQCVREVDTLARYGGDEFTILLVDTEHDEALRIAERIRRTVEEHVFEAGGEGSLRLTISIGVATCPNHGAERDPLLDSADKAMYRAKSLGRNRVCSAADLAT